jgi:hypothetical protein
MTSPSTAPPNRSRGTPLMLLGLGAAILGLAGYCAQISLERLMAPWYVPVLAALGVALVVVSLLERRTVGRKVALVVLVLLTGAELALLYTLRLPAYHGPILTGRTFPPFEAKRADGTPFTQSDFSGDQNNVLVFFRGRW